MKFEIYKDEFNEWRWRLKARNGKIVADSAEGYKRKSVCANGIKFLQSADRARIVEVPAGE
jgi:uncharacterized protein YegP (UPF0339 family)